MTSELEQILRAMTAQVALLHENVEASAHRPSSSRCFLRGNPGLLSLHLPPVPPIAGPSLAAIRVCANYSGHLFSGRYVIDAVAKNYRHLI